MITGRIRGHEISYDKETNKWYFINTGEECDDTIPCAKCGKSPTKQGHDGCLGTLPFVKNACCGHGDLRRTYVMFNNGKTIREKKAERMFKLLKLIRLKTNN